MPLGTEIGLSPGHIVLDGDPAPHGKGTAAPTFRPMFIVAKRSPISATAELVFFQYTLLIRWLVGWLDEVLMVLFLTQCDVVLNEFLTCAALCYRGLCGQTKNELWACIRVSLTSRYCVRVALLVIIQLPK